MSLPSAVQDVLWFLNRRYGTVTRFGRSRLFQIGTELSCSVNYSKLLRGDKFFFGLSQEVVDPTTAYPESTHGAFVLLVCGDAENVLVLPRPLVLGMLEGVETRRIDVFMDEGCYVLQTTRHPKLDVTDRLNAYPRPEKETKFAAEMLDSEPARPESIRDHVAMQWALIRLGRAAGHSVWVPPGDRHLAFGDHDFASSTLDRLPHLGFDEGTRRVVQNIDVLWTERSTIRKAFEIESTTAVYSGLLRLNDLVLGQPNNRIDLYIAASEERRALVSRQLMRPTFQPLLPRCQFLGFSQLRSQLERLDALQGDASIQVSGLVNGERFEMPDHMLYPPQ